MALIRCEDCDKAISPEAYTCPHCGRPMRSRWTPLLWGALIVAGGFFLTHMRPEGQDAAAEPAKAAPEAEKKRAATPAAPAKPAPAKAKRAEPAQAPGS